MCGLDKAAAGVFICLLVAATACCSLRKLENADGAAGSVYSLRNMTIYKLSSRDVVLLQRRSVGCHCLEKTSK